MDLIPDHYGVEECAMEKTRPRAKIFNRTYKALSTCSRKSLLNSLSQTAEAFAVIMSFSEVRHWARRRKHDGGNRRCRNLQ
jgi:hypothetical protein